MKKIVTKHLENLKRALKELQEYCAISVPKKVEKAGVIQAFEFTFEILWKTLKIIGEDQGLSSNSPKSAFKQAFKLGLIADESLWLKILEDRNLTVHTYNELLADQIYHRVKTQYLGAFCDTFSKVEKIVQAK